MTTTFNPTLHPRDHISGQFAEAPLADPGQVGLGATLGCQPQVAEHPEDGSWRVTSPRFDGTEYRFDGWPHLLARYNSAAALLPDRRDNMGRLHTLAAGADGPRQVTLLYRDDKGRVIAAEKEVLAAYDDEGEDQPILARDPGDETYRWLDDDLDLLAVRAGCDVEQMGEWWLNHVACSVPDTVAPTREGIPDAEWTRRDAPVAAVFLMSGELYADERPAGAVFLAQAGDRHGMYGQLLVPGHPPREEYVFGTEFGGRVPGYTAGRIRFEDVAVLPVDAVELYRSISG